MAVTLLARAASRVRPAVFLAAGAGSEGAATVLRRSGRLHLVPTPRHASVLLAAGNFPDPLLEPLARVHDQMPHPRATLWWTGRAAGDLLACEPSPEVVSPAGDPVTAALELARRVVSGARPSESGVLADEPPRPWRGVGPHGQGGEGMMGGTPYGRPMPMTAPDRDGLELDQVRVRLGPFLPGFPAGLAMDAVLQGDVLQHVALAPNPFAPALPATAGAGVVELADRPFARAATEPVPVAELERGRARHHLAWLADFLALHALPALATRAAALAETEPAPRPSDVRRLGRLLGRTAALRLATRGVGPLGGERLGPHGGPLARASGVAVDARARHPAYRHLGFEPVVHDGGDSASRWRQRLAEAEQALVLAAAAGDAVVEPGDPVESPRGPVAPPGGHPGTDLLGLVPEVLPGMEWGSAVTTLASLDLTMEGAPARATVGAP